MAETDHKLIDNLKSYASLDPARFHMPGHKGRLSLNVFENFADIDVTEISGTDDLHHPEGVLLRIEERYSKLYRAKASFLLVNGSTAGNIAMMLSIGSGKRILLARNCHKSALAGIALAGHQVYPLYPDLKSGVISPEEIDSALAVQPADAVFITSPTYYGLCSDIDKIAKISHKHGAKLFVDCAHGAHFPFASELPHIPSSADAWVVSCHKTLNSLTQTAVLNIGTSNDTSAYHMRSCLSLVQSSSPSYLLMLSLENALDDVGNWESHYKRILHLRQDIAAISGVSILTGSDSYAFDPTRLTISVAGISGYALSNYLEEHCIFVEMSDISAVVLITSPSDPDEWYDRLKQALSNIPLQYKDRMGHSGSSSSAYAAGKRAISVRDAMLCESEPVFLKDAVNKISAHAVGAYPPGIATLFPGEQITAEAVEYLTQLTAYGAKLFGTHNEKILVLKEKS